MNLANPMTLEDAIKGWKVTIADKGGYCPCCGKWGKVYRQKISEAMVKSLLPIDVGAAIGDDGVGQEKKFSGYWRVTSKGMQFARGFLQVPKYVYIYDNKYMDSSTETVYSRDCFGEDFNYDEIMSTTWADGNYHHFERNSDG